MPSLSEQYPLSPHHWVAKKVKIFGEDLHTQYASEPLSQSASKIPFAALNNTEHHQAASLISHTSKMPNSLEKTRKQISKKRNGDINSLHAKSRNSMRLNKAGIRDVRLERLASSRNKRERPIGMNAFSLPNTVSYFC